MPELKANTRYLLMCPLGSQKNSGPADAFVAEIAATSRYARVVWVTGESPTALPQVQEWLPVSAVESAVLEELPRTVSVLYRAASVPPARPVEPSAGRQTPGTRVMPINGIIGQP
jgi:hypothetical protein